MYLNKMKIIVTNPFPTTVPRQIQQQLYLPRNIILKEVIAGSKGSGEGMTNCNGAGKSSLKVESEVIGIYEVDITKEQFREYEKTLDAPDNRNRSFFECLVLFFTEKE